MEFGVDTDTEEIEGDSSSVGFIVALVILVGLVVFGLRRRARHTA